MKRFVVFMVFLLCSIPFYSRVMAQDFIYEPKNPSFGGQTFNYQWMLSSAQAQDTFKDPNAQTAGQLSGRGDPLEDFAQNLNRQILNQLANKLITSQFGEQGLQPGQFVIGNFQIDISEMDGAVNVVIVDQSTGNQTTVTIPTF